MKLQRRFASFGTGVQAGTPLLVIWLSAVLVTMTAGASVLPLAPAGTVVDSDIVTDTTWTFEGSPYQVAFASSGILVAEGVTLRIEPGVEVRFAPNASLIVLGKLTAIGTADRPILFTGAVKEPGSWLFMAIEGDGETRNQGSVLRHVTIEYGQWNLMIMSAVVHVSECVLRHASEAGLWTMQASGTVVEGCQIVDNLTYGLENSHGGLILAANNWWGSASGPYHQDCNPTGTGNTIEDFYSQGVAFRPFLTVASQDPAPVSAGDALRLTIKPQRWFAPADGVSLIPVEITLRDGAGLALAGRSVCLYTDLGNAAGCAITDGSGKALTYVNSDTPGDATLQAWLDDSGECEYAGSSEAMVTFGEYAGDALLPDAEAPYMNSQIDVNPKPIIQGAPGTVSARLTNPNNYPIEVSATFGYAEFGLGVAFSPLGGQEDVRIEAGDSQEINVPWTPPVSGHVCLRIDYVAQPAGRGAAGTQAVGGGQSNFAIQPGPLGSPGMDEGQDPDEEEEEPEGDTECEKDMLEKTRAAMDRINDGQMALDAIASPENLTGLAIPNALFSQIMDFNLDNWAKAAQSLGTCPPRQDYDTYATLESYPFTPLVAGGDLSAARAAAGNALMEAMLELTARWRAATMSLDRYSGASNAGDLYWASEQAALLIYFKQESGARMLEVADRLDLLLDVMHDEGVEDLTVLVPTVEAYQARLTSAGFNSEEVEAARTIGLSDAEIEAIRQARIAADPAEVAGSVMNRLAAVAGSLRLLGAVLMDPPNFDETGTIQAALEPAAGTNLARIYVSRTPFQIRNPLSTPATVQLRARTLDLPSDWMVAVAPELVDLGPGETATGLISIRPGLAAVQGTQSRVAVEGYVDDELIGGVVVDVMVPRQVAAGPKRIVYLPLVLRRHVP